MYVHTYLRRSRAAPHHSSKRYRTYIHTIRYIGIYVYMYVGTITREGRYVEEDRKIENDVVFSDFLFIMTTTPHHSS